MFSVSNDGTRPANDALVTFRAKGNFKIMPPPARDGHENSDEEAERPFGLPNLPRVPRGRWTGASSILTALDPLHDHHGLFGLPMPRPFVAADLLRGIGRERDPNGFYYKPDRSSFPVTEFGLECKPWRHAIEPELFVGQLHLNDDAQEISGAIECRVHAENLSASISKVVPIHIRVRSMKVVEIAKEMLDQIREE